MTAPFLQLCEVAVRPFPGRIVAPGLTHERFRANVAHWRREFSSHGGLRWALYFEDAVEFAAALFGAWHAGVVPVLCPDALPVTVDRLSCQVSGFAGDFPGGCATLARATGAAGAHAPWRILDESATRLVIFTSGSTGEPARIEKTLGQLAREVESLQEAFGALVGSATVHGTVSHQHIYGLLFRVLWPLAAGLAIAPRRFFLEDLQSTIDAPAILITSPAHLKRIPASLTLGGALTPLCAVFSSGGVLADADAERARAALGHAPIEVLGSTETGGIAWRKGGETMRSWTGLPGVRWRVVDGQLEVGSPHLPDSGWWRTADRARALDQGDGFELLGRADRIVKVEERRVSLVALEHALARLAGVAEVRVLLLDGARAELAAVVVPTRKGLARLQSMGRRAYARELGLALAGGFEAAARPRRWRFVDALPVNQQGKSTDAALRELFRPTRPGSRWLRREATRAELELELGATLAAFDGHFPGSPILPGVAQLDWAVRYGREAFALPAHVRRMEALKFHRVARQGSRLRLALEWSSQMSVLTFHYTSDHGVHSSGRLVFEAGPE